MTGRILNRFSKDTYTVDETLMPSIYMYLQCMTAVLGTIIVIGACLCVCVCLPVCLSVCVCVCLSCPPSTCTSSV